MSVFVKVVSVICGTDKCEKIYDLMVCVCMQNIKGACLARVCGNIVGKFGGYCKIIVSSSGSYHVIYI